MISSENILKVCDFGSAQFIGTMRDEMNNSAGTFAFMPPEAHKDGAYKGKPADIWACGITLFYMITGKLPFSSRKVGDFCNLPKEFHIEFPEDFGEELKDLIRAMTDMNPSLRIPVRKIKKHPWVSVS